MLNGFDGIALIGLLVVVAIISWIWFTYGKAVGRQEMLDERMEDVLAQGRRRDALAGSGRQCTVCGGRLQYDEGQWWHVGLAAARGQHRPLPDFMVGPAQPA
jgi:type II secretory pathway pseudopilin PulG